MIAITSIAPGHKNFDNQQRAIQSWKDAGYKVISLNSEEEIEQLKDFDVEFIPTKRHNKLIFGKPYVLVSAIIDYLKEIKSEYSLIINSDIIIKDSTGTTSKLKERSENGIIVMNRIDYVDDMAKGNIYDMGFDGFFINGKYLESFPQSILCLGQCHWDYWLPYVASINGVNILRQKEPYIYHKMHDIQYSRIDYKRTGEIFRAELGIFKLSDVGQVNNYVFRHIRTNLK